MTIIVSGAIIASNAIIGYKNLLTTTGGTITSSSAATDYDAENIADWRPFTWWKPTSTGNSWVRVSFATAKVVNYFAVASHDLATSGSTIKLQYSTNGGSSWIDATTENPGTDDMVIVETFDDITAADWRIYVSNPTTIAAIGVVSFGEGLELPYQQEVGFAPPTLSRDAEYLTNQSSSGLFLGRSIERTGYPGIISMSAIPQAWIRSEWEPFLDHAELKPFFFSWNDAEYSSEAVFAWTDGKISPAKYSSPLRMSISLKFNSVR